jgi:predicted Zn-dependent protease
MPARADCWAHSLAVTNNPAIGFGSGLPAHGSPVTFAIGSDQLTLTDWPGLTQIRRHQLRARTQGEVLLLEWANESGQCALSVAKVSPGGTALRAWLPAERIAHDGGTKRWLALVLFLCLGLPVLLFAALVGYRSELVDLALDQVTVAQEQKLADALWQGQRSRLRLIEGKPVVRFVEETGARLVAASATPTPYRYQFFVADDPSVNAFAMPGGYIVVHTGLIAKANSAEEVAGVLAHEIEHVEQRHSLRGLIQAAGLSAIGVLITGDLSGGSAAWLTHLIGLEFSREHETASDTAGVKRLIAAQIDPRGMASFFELLAKEQAALPDALSMLSTHPASSERVKSLENLLQDAPTFPKLPVDWSALQAELKR